MNFKALLVGLIFVSSGLSAFPQYQGYVTDPGGMLTAAQSQVLSAYSKQLEQKTGAQVATVILPEVGEDWTVDDYANQLFEAWGIGQKGKDNGVLFLVAVKERKMRIEVGYGLEHVIPDGKAGEILDTAVLPHFKSGNMYQGVLAGHLSLVSVVAEAYKIQLETPVHVRSSAQKSSPASNFIMLLILGLVIFGMIKSPTFRAFMIGMMVASMFSRGGRRSGVGHFGGGGGFGGFGGGMSGGGGAGRGW